MRVVAQVQPDAAQAINSLTPPAWAPQEVKTNAARGLQTQSGSGREHLTLNSVSGFFQIDFTMLFKLVAHSGRILASLLNGSRL